MKRNKASTGQKYLMMILCVISCSIHAIAQTDYYYNKKNKIPLTRNENKVIVSIPKDCEKTSERILANVKKQNKIFDDSFDIFTILRSDYEKLTSLDSWKEDSKSVLITSSYMTENDDEVYATPYLNVELKKEQDIDILTSYAEEYGLKIVKKASPLMPLWYILAITQDCKINSVECANKLWESGKFAASVPDLSFNKSTCSNDPMYNQQWGLHNDSYPGIDIIADSAWMYATGKYVKIAFLDTGIDLNHIDLASHISNLSYDTETASSPSVVYYPHGTHCAGIAAAVKDNNICIAGVAPEAKIISISNRMDTTTTNDLLKRADGIRWAYQHGADIISNSWSASIEHPAVDNAIHDAFIYGRQGKGCVIVFSSGNDYHPYVAYPANCNDTILAVGAIFSTGSRWFQSNYGEKLDLVAPGHSILSTTPNDSVMYDSGTSMACPHVAGVAALILERNPELTVTQVNSIICSNAKKKPTDVYYNVTKPYGTWHVEYGYGLVDAYHSVKNTPSLIYIQNETLTGTRTISADNIYVGKDVTDRIAQGDVTLGQGNITLKAGYVEIKNSTTVPLGTTLTIENN